MLQIYIYIYIYIYTYINHHIYYNSPFLSLAGARVARQLSFNVDNGLGIGEETALSLSCIINSGKNPPWRIGVDEQNSLPKFSESCMYIGIFCTYTLYIIYYSYSGHAIIFIKYY